MAASVLYGGVEMRLLKGAFTGIRKIPTLLNFAKKPLRETHNIVKATSHHTPLKQIFEQAKSSEKVAAKWEVTEATKKAGRKRFVPDINATGAHSVFRREPLAGKISKYETYQLQSNPLDPKHWESVKRYDGY